MEDASWKSVAFSMERFSSESSVYQAIKTTQFSQCTHFNHRPNSMLLTNTAVTVQSTCLSIKICIFFSYNVFMFHIFLTIHSSNQLVFLMETQCQPYYFWVCDNA